MNQPKPRASSYGSKSRPAALDKIPIRPELAVLGMKLFLVSLSALFAVGLVGCLAVRLRAAAWPPAGIPPLSKGLWVSTILILASSATVQWALRGARRGRQRPLRAGLPATALLGALFLVSQIANWRRLIAAQITVQSSLYAFTFFTLGGLHGAHVVVGLIPLGLVAARAFRGRYGPDSHLGVRLCAMCWHFLDGVWLAMFAALFLGS